MSVTPRQYAFQQSSLDRAEHLRDDLQALHRHWNDARLLVVDDAGLAHFHGQQDAPEFHAARDYPGGHVEASTFLGLDTQGLAWFATRRELLHEPPPCSLDLRSAAVCWPALPASAFAQARALLYWQQRNRFCGSCGAALRLVRAGFVARCDACSTENYPRTDPAIIVAVSDGQQLLLGRQASWPEKRWSVLAGFAEPGESLEEAVAREVMEEAGVRVHNCRYLASQPWPFPSALMLGFSADADVQPVEVGAELQDARWFSAVELRDQIASGDLKISPRLSISRWLIDDWLARH